MFDTQHYLTDLDRWLSLVGAADVDGVAVAEADRERAADLFRDAALIEVIGEVAGPAPAIAELVMDAASAWRLAEIAREASAPAGAPWPCGPQGPPSWAEAGYWCGATADAAERHGARRCLETVAGAVARGEADLTRARDALALAVGAPPAWPLWERSRQRSLGEVAKVAGDLLARTDEAHRMALRSARLAAGPDPSWVDLPARLAGGGATATLPGIDAQLLRVVAAALGAERLLAERLRVRIGSSAPPHAGVLVVQPGARVHAWLRPLGPARDYRVALRLLGRALALAGVEDAAGCRARATDPAVAACFGALLESLPSIGAWRQRLLRHDLPAVGEEFAGQSRLRLRLLAAEVVAAASDAAPRSPARLVALGESGAAAVGIDHPDVPVPWSHRGGEAADELVGWLLAAEVEERLASRFGRDWLRQQAAGRFLRDLWAAAPATAGALADDLGIRGLGDVELIVERWFRRPL